uniref:Ribosomal protein L32 n=1 Tax=Nitzschia sp. PL1-4 TaxID=2083272 RepID=A0A2Z5ZB34_9STRA|nr:ribosomal protein L32 [Nitzschia sp. PL1-4]
MAVPKKKVSKMKRNIHRSLWKKKAFKKAKKFLSIAKSNLSQKLDLRVKNNGFLPA